MLPGKAAKPRNKDITKSELGFRCLGVGLFLYFIFFVVPRLGSPSCKTALDRDLKTLQDLQEFLQQLAEEHKHDADKAKHLLSLAQQLGGGSVLSGASPANTSSLQQLPPHHAANSSTAAAQQLTPGAAFTQQLLETQSDLASAKKVIRKHEQLLQAQLQEATMLRAELQRQQQQTAAVGNHQTGAASIADAQASSRAASCSASAVQAIAIQGASCGVLQGVELGGDVVVWGSEHKTNTAAECCAACLAHSRAIQRGVGHDSGRAAKACNVWVHCSNAQACGERLGECWLKFDPQASAAASRAAADIGSTHSSGGQEPAMWMSGAPQQDRPAADFEAARLGVAIDWLAPSLTSTPTAAAPVLVWSTALGQVRVHLRPDLAPGSVRELVRMAVLLMQHSGGHCSNCRIYRAEPGFLVQGVLEAAGAYVAVPRHPNPPQPTLMPRGMLCWAGGGGGPDWFVNMVDQGGFADQHLCFGQVDESSLAAFQRILQLPVKPRGGADSVEMVLLQQPVRFTVTLDHA